VDFGDAFDFLCAQTLEKFSQSGYPRKIAKSKKFLKTTVVCQYPGVGNSFETSYHSVKNAKNQVCGMIVAGAPVPWNIGLKKTLYLQFSTKVLKKEHSTIVGKCSVIEGKFNLSYTFRHSA